MKKSIFITVLAVSLVACSGQSFNQKDFDDEWPFTVERVTVGCDAMGLPYVEANGRTTYGLTGFAVQRGYPSVSPIHIQGKDLGSFIRAALEECR